MGAPLQDMQLQSPLLHADFQMYCKTQLPFPPTWPVHTILQELTDSPLDQPLMHVVPVLQVIEQHP